MKTLRDYMLAQKTTMSVTEHEVTLLPLFTCLQSYLTLLDPMRIEDIAHLKRYQYDALTTLCLGSTFHKFQTTLMTHRTMDVDTSQTFLTSYPRRTHVEIDIFPPEGKQLPVPHSCRQSQNHKSF